jgi:hypothetical protein
MTYTDQEDITLKLLPYMGWYIDFGFDRPNKRNAKNSFAFLLRMSGSFAKEIAKPSSENFKYPPDTEWYELDTL